MNWLDAVILVVFAIVAVTGLRMGGVGFAAIGLGVLVGIAMASRLQGKLEPVFSSFMDSENGSEIAAFIAILVLAIFASMVAGSVLRRMLKIVMLGWLDQAAGLAAGLIVAFSLGSAILSNIQSFPILDLQDAIDGSTLGSFLADNFDVVLRGLRFVPSDLGT